VPPPATPLQVTQEFNTVMTVLRPVFILILSALALMLSACGSTGQTAGARAAGYILDPRVSVEVINYRPFYILGEVGKPGEYPFTNGLTVQNAVAAAGGFSYRANKKVVYIKSMDSDREIAYDLTPATVVKPGDTLRIGERIF
jgi:protein involved in polysaccharide export with SLBB domain